jgi:hypothetical protein
LPTLKLSEPPGAVRPDGNLKAPPPDRLPGQSPVILNHKSNSINADEHFDSLCAGCALQQKVPEDSKAGKQKNKLSP